jgi:threonine/homoserine/homoserine lactone efflux protein
VIDPARLAAFAAVTALTSLVPGPSMLFVLSQSAWRKARGGVAALAGLQIGYIGWWLLAGLGLDTLLREAPLLFRLLTLAGAAYLAWLGWRAWRASRRDRAEPSASPARASRHAFRDGVLVALSNPKSLVYIVALLPPFLDTAHPVVPQLVVLWLVAMAIDVAIGAAYIGAGSRLAAAMARPALRAGIERGVGAIFLALAAAIAVSVARAM